MSYWPGTFVRYRKPPIVRVKEASEMLGLPGPVVRWLADIHVLSQVPMGGEERYYFLKSDVILLRDRPDLAELVENAEANRERFDQQRNARRRALRLAKNGGTATRRQIADRVAYYGERCYMCGGAYEAIDHVVAVAVGGTGWPANLRPACTSCNTSKHTRPPEPRPVRVRPLP